MQITVIGTSEKEREEAFGQFDHLRIYGKDYVQKLKDVGFQVEIKNFCNEDSSNIKFGLFFFASIIRDPVPTRSNQLVGRR